MHSVADQLQHLVHITPSGCCHPYYAVKENVGADTEMIARLSTYPRLGEGHTVKADTEKVTFTAVVESDTKHAWQVQLWHNFAATESWESLPFQPSEAVLFSAGTTTNAPNLKRQFFTATLEGKASRPVSFTVRYRSQSNGAENAWSWAHDNFGVKDGQLFYYTEQQTSDDLHDFIQCIDAQLKIEERPSETPNTKVWSISAPVTGAEKNTSGVSHYVLGLPKDFQAWFALVRLWSPWLAPRHGKDVPLAEKDGLLYSFQRRDGLHLILLAISGIEDVLSIFQANQDKLVIEARNDREEDGTTRVVAAVGRSFDEANCAAIYEARKIVAAHTFTNKAHQELEEMTMELNERHDEVKADWFEEWYDGFTYCTWNALGQNLSEEKIMNALESLESNNIKISNLIIDDNWQSLDNEGENQFNRGWDEFEANKTGFPLGIGHTARNIRKKYPSIRHIAVWHAILGYWGAIAPKGKIAADYKTRIVAKRPQFGPPAFTVVDASSVQEMYNDAYSFLSSSGIDSVKTDAQFMLDEIDEAPARRELTSKYLTAWNTAQLRHFGGHAISCMSQTPSIIFLAQLPKYLPKLPVRNSDDFFPEIENSHPWHIFCNAHNALLAQHLNVLPDWDMFQTSHKWAGFHAAARCVSGGPIYITDEPGNHDVGLIHQMTAQTPQNKTVILRPSTVGASTQVYTSYEELRLCYVGAYNGMSETGTSFLAAFNCSMGTSIPELVSLDEFVGISNKNGYVVRSHRTEKVSPVMLPGDANSTLMLQLEAREWEIMSASPVSVVHAQGRSEPVRVADLGLVGKMTGGAAIVSSGVQTELGNRIKVSTTLKALGVWGVWVETLDNVDLDDIMVVMEQKPLPLGCVQKSKADSRVLEMDLQDAWKRMDLQPGWSNEVTASLYLRV